MTPLLDAVTKALDFIGRYSFAVLVVTAFILFIPKDAADRIGLFALRTEYKGICWIVLVLSAALWFGAVFNYFDKRFLDGWLARRAEQRKEEAEKRKREAKEQAALHALEFRLQSLDAREREWIIYCLFHNTQTLSAQRADRTAQSLVDKDIVREGSGHILDLPFHFPDDVWRYLLAHKEDFLPSGAANNKQLRDALERFRKSLHAV